VQTALHVEHVFPPLLPILPISLAFLSSVGFEDQNWPASLNESKNRYLQHLEAEA
jgi:hypothetical protein